MKAFSRRNFIIGGSVVSLQGMLIGVAGANDSKGTAIETMADGFDPNIWIHIPNSGAISLVVHRSEMGQQARTSCAMMLAEELCVELDQITVIQAQGDAKFGDQNTDGSTTGRKNWTPLREAGAYAREMLISAAAKKWNVDRKTLNAEKGTIVHKATSQTATYQSLAADAAKVKYTGKANLLSSDSQHTKVIGKFQVGIDNKDIVSGKAIYGIDVEVEGMLYASIERCPVPWGGSLISFEAAEVLQVPGVKKVVHLEAQSQPINTNESIAVIATSYNAAQKGRDALKIKWDIDGDLETSADTLKEAREMAKDSLRELTAKGDFDDELDLVQNGERKLHQLELVTPYLVHAQMEPLAATAHVTKQKCQVWAPTQAPQRARGEVAEYLDMDLEKVEINVTLLGGGFGRKSQADFINEAVALSKNVGAPVKVVWSREDDMKHSFKHAWSLQKLEATTSKTGEVTGFRHRTIFPTLGTVFSSLVGIAELIGKLDMETDMGVSNMPYSFANLTQEAKRIDADVRIGWFRAVCNNFHAFGIQSMLDHLALETKVDPIAFHLKYLKKTPDKGLGAKDFSSDRYANVIKRVAEASNWKNQNDRFLGFAAHYSFFSYVATVVELEKSNNSRGFNIKEVWLSIDCGRSINPDAIAAQLEGAAVFGITMALYGEITIKNGEVEQNNFDDYPVLRFDESPVIHTDVVQSEYDPTGVGEPGVPPIPPAIANAVTRLKGQRPMKLPIT